MPKTNKVLKEKRERILYDESESERENDKEKDAWWCK